MAATRAAIAAACVCDDAVAHGTYVRCARRIAQTTLANPSCVAAVVRCATRSTCGRPDAVACCQTSAAGATRASIKDERSCRAPEGGAACVSPLSSACDACTATGCAAPPTSSVVPSGTPTRTPTPTLGPSPTQGCGNGVVDPGEDCDAPTCSATFDGESVTATCGAPGTLHACECQDVQCGSCPKGSGSELCWSSDECFMQPGGGLCILGSCLPTVCESFNDCRDAAPGCEDGHCCTISPPNFCRLPGQFEVPCCGAAICGAGDFCCLPAGEACTGTSLCCNGSCTGGICN